MFSSFYLARQVMSNSFISGFFKFFGICYPPDIVGVFSRINLSFLLRVFRKTAMMAAQRCVVYLTIATVVPMFVFGVSSMNWRRNAVSAVEDLDKPFCGVTYEPDPVEVLEGYLDHGQLQRLCVIETSSASNFYKDILAEVDLDVHNVRFMGDEEKWTYEIKNLLIRRLHVLKVYLRFIEKCTYLAADLQEKFQKTLYKKLRTLNGFSSISNQFLLQS